MVPPRLTSRLTHFPLARTDALTPAVDTLDDLITRLFEQLRTPIYRYLVSSYGEPDDAEEITQEVFLRLYGVLAEGQDIDNPRAWAFRVAHNLAVNRVQRQAPVHNVDAVSWNQLCQVTVDESPNPEQVMLADERRTWIRARAAELSELQRGCLLLRVEGFRYREIAEILAVSVSTVAESIRRGVRHLNRAGRGD